MREIHSGLAPTETNTNMIKKTEENSISHLSNLKQ